VAYITIPVIGWLSDRVGRRTMYRALSGLLVLWSFPSWWMLSEIREPWVVFVVMIVGLSVGVLGLYAVQSSYFPELFGSRYRYLGLAMGKEIGGVLAGGIAPLVAAGLIAAFSGSWVPIAVYTFLLASVSFITTFFAPETRGRDLELPNDPQPGELLPLGTRR
jgi:MHS family metabolite:H+ symporter-like MFS transporter